MAACTSPTLSGHLVVVVVEDDVLIRTLVADTLRDARFTVIEANHADEALAVLEIHAAHVRALFTDIEMPGSMDGLELAHRARRNWPWIAVMIASGKRRPPSDMLPPGSHFLPKPYKLEDIAGNVRTLIESK